MFSKLIEMIRQVIHKMIPYKSIESVERIDTPLSQDMIAALDAWHNAYINKPEWKKENTVHTLNLPAFISSEIARQMLLEMKWSITGKASKSGEALENPRSEYLKAEFEKLITSLCVKLEQGCAAGGMTIKPYPKGKHLHFDVTLDWDLYPIAFGDDGDLIDVIFRDSYTEGKTIFTKLERHQLLDGKVRITNRVFKSDNRNTIGVEVSLKEVPLWESIQPEATVSDSNGQLFGWYKVVAANNVDVNSPMGISVFAKALEAIKDADEQYSRLLWEFEGGEMAIDVDPSAVRPKNGKNGADGYVTPRLNQRLFRGVDLGADGTYNVFNPNLRDASLISGLNEILMKIEDLSGLAHGTISNVSDVARTATELKIVRNRTYTTIHANQESLERCLRDVIRVMDVYATTYNLAPNGDYDVSFEWDDSIITDTSQQLSERLMLRDAGLVGKVELRMWYFGETRKQAEDAIQQIADENTAELMRLAAFQTPPV